MTTDDKPAPVHPAPWRWGDSKLGRKHRLLDANGNAITLAWADDTSRSYHDIEVRVANRRLETLIAAAPEMEALLREGMKGVDLCHFQNLRRLQGQDIGEPCGACWACKVLPVLARIDAAKGG